MSADNWRICPKCQGEALKAKAKAITDAVKAYGNVSQEEYQRLKAIEDSFPARIPHSLREDYEIGTDSYGKFYVSYGCSCADCGFEFTHKYEEQVTPCQE